MAGDLQCLLSTGTWKFCLVPPSADPDDCLAWHRVGLVFGNPLASPDSCQWVLSKVCHAMVAQDILQQLWENLLGSLNYAFRCFRLAGYITVASLTRATACFQLLIGIG